MLDDELSDLVSRGLVLQRGSRRWAYYELVPELENANEPVQEPGPQRRADRREEILAVFEEGDLTRAGIANATGLPDKTVSRG